MQFGYLILSVELLDTHQEKDYCEKWPNSCSRGGLCEEMLKIQVQLMVGIIHLTCRTVLIAGVCRIVPRSLQGETVCTVGEHVESGVSLSWLVSWFHHL